MEASETRGTTALVYCLISSSLYTGTVQGCGLTVSRGEVHPNWFDGQQGCSQLSTNSYYEINWLCIGTVVPLHLISGGHHYVEE